MNTGNGVPVLPGVAITVSPPTESPRATAEGIAATTHADTTEAALPELDPDYTDALVKKAGTGVSAATPPPSDPDRSPVDRWAFEAVGALAERVDQLYARMLESTADVLKAARRVASLLAPWTTKKRIGVVVGLVVLCALTSLGVANLLTPGMQAIFVRPALVLAWGRGSRELIFYVSFSVSFIIVASLLGAQMAAAVITWGGLGRRKWLFVCGDVCFSVAFSILRGSHALLPSVAAGLFEVALLAGTSMALGVADKRFNRDAERADQHRLATAELAAETEEMERNRRAYVEARAELATQVAAHADREALVRTLPVRRAHAEETARVAVMAATAAGIAKAIENPAETGLSTMLEKELTATYRDYRKTVDERSF